MKSKRRAQRRPRARQTPPPRQDRKTSTRPGTVRTRDRSVVEGIVSAHRSGFGFVRVEGQSPDVFLAPPEMQNLMSGDRVRIRVHEDRTGRLSGEVQSVLARGVESFLATLEATGRQLFARAADRRLALRAFVPQEHSAGARVGDWVIARLTRYPTAVQTAVAHVDRRLDPDRPLELATETAIARYSLPTTFPSEALQEAEAFGERVDPTESSRRADLRSLPLVTIDGEDARDFDDAVYAEADGEGWRLIVAIADVSHYVRPGTAIDREAIARGTSVYFPRRVLPMLPTALSDHLCSLAPEVDRLCFAADLRVGRAGKLLSSRFYPAVMRSHARLTYTKAHAALFEGRLEARRELGALLPKLMPLVDLYRALLKARHRRGALDFESAQASFSFDDSGRVHEIGSYARNDAHKLIEECMILANVAVAEVLSRAKQGALFRVHGKPEQEKLDKLLAWLTALGIDAEIPESVEPRHLRELTRRLPHGAARPFVESLVVRSMPQAQYQPTNIGHFGLSLKTYAHFTSPIRRYPDLVVHRALKALLDPRDASGVNYSPDRLEPLGEELSRLERRADESDRYVDTFLKCSWLRERLGQAFDGVVTTTVEFGCFIQISGVGVDGLLHTQAMRDDEYRMNEAGTAWIGGRTGRTLAMGTAVRVIVVSVNPVEGLIDLELAP